MTNEPQRTSAGRLEGSAVRHVFSSHYYNLLKIGGLAICFLLFQFSGFGLLLFTLYPIAFRVHEKLSDIVRKQPNTAAVFCLQTPTLNITTYGISQFWLEIGISGAPKNNFRKNICSEDDLRSRIFGTFVVKFLACLLLLGFSNI